ncbi:hypothetical protein LR48_Vigan07g098100 [Vigna angularis]|uniref:Uncharacterized protein n=2 Tax=Phaseolus angularis TaxID=3914 RepID=A0A0L9UXG6_PHAAN|nr:uncharacterized protein LOC108337720 [Vigna angularis]KAG2391488.1 uncharacterized protein HKW66_Vig0127510 [Vigna angularis]KOM47277.1 hypothetical protein LR48_Vigan07g098100 [Vigna angularis]BAT81429.1 hypothetical protein VIGAN_03115200 [Vigna angularis var. angularis]
MKVRFFALFLLISGIQAISTSYFNTSEDKGLIQSNGEAQQLLGELHESIKESTSVKYQVEDRKEEAIDTTRKTQGGGSSGSSGRPGNGGSSDVTRRPRPSSATSQPHFSVSVFILSVNLASVILFFFHYV